MIAVDTNVLLRYLFHADDPSQGALAVSLVDGASSKGEPVFVSTLVACELVWTLKSALGLDRGEILAVLQELLTHAAEDARPRFAFESETLFREAVDEFAAGKADFADYLIGRAGAAAGASTTYTFDRIAAGASTFKRLTTGAIE